VVIYEENQSFDNLYEAGGVNGLDHATAVQMTHVAHDGSVYTCRLQNDVNLLLNPGLCATPNGSFNIGTYIPADARTCPQPGVFALHGLTPSPANLPGGCTEELVHRFYQEQYQLSGPGDAGSGPDRLAVSARQLRSRPLAVRHDLDPGHDRAALRVWRRSARGTRPWCSLSNVFTAESPFET
jgi:hypothetical protein